ncbi:MAG: TIGR03016 family PEP-CTERM system-associated outer membrane protein [Rubrivivax sp.]|nr:TIGR03016 family PEP-CTERM system-associated outer membrane protein [Rubrivivax sp.]
MLGAAVGGVALQLAPHAAHAQKLRLDWSLETQLVATSNAAQVAGPNARSDLLLDLHPRMRLQTLGAGVRLDMTAGVVARNYLQRTQPNRAEPELDLRTTAEVVDGWVTLDGSVSVSSVATDPFTGRAQDSGDVRPDSFRQSRASITPRLKRDLSPEWSVQASSGHGWQRSDDPNTLIGARETTHTEDTLWRVDRRPVPLGMHVELRRQRQNNDAAPPDGTVLALDAVRAGASYRLNPQLVAGLTVGRERSAYLSNDNRDNIVGFHAEWLPTERSWLRGTVEKRFFGQAFDVSVSHRSPFMALSGTWSRQPGITSTSLGTGGAGSSVAGLLDGLLTTRIPNPVDRAAAVNRLITERGLPASFGQASEIVDQTPQLVQNGAVSLVLLGVRHSVALGLFSRSARELKREGELSLGLSSSDFRQRGGSALVSRRLSPTMTLSLALDRTVTDGLAATAGDYLREWKARADVSVALAPRTQLSFGVGRSLVRSNRAGDQQETRAHVGLLQNF